MSDNQRRSENAPRPGLTYPRATSALLIQSALDDVIEETSLFDSSDDPLSDEIDDIVRCLGVRVLLL